MVMVMVTGKFKFMVRVTGKFKFMVKFMVRVMDMVME